MIKYFKELLSTLKSIDAQLKASDKKLELLSSCVKAEHSGDGAKTSISTKLWNDAR
jgi:hypothetical protein